MYVIFNGIKITEDFSFRIVYIDEFMSLTTEDFQACTCILLAVYLT